MGLHRAQSVFIVNDPNISGNGENVIEAFTCPHCGRVFPLGRHIGTDGKIHDGGEGGVCRKHMRVVCKSPGCVSCSDYLSGLGL